MTVRGSESQGKLTGRDLIQPESVKCQLHATFERKPTWTYEPETEPSGHQPGDFRRRDVSDPHKWPIHLESSQLWTIPIRIMTIDQTNIMRGTGGEKCQHLEFPEKLPLHLLQRLGFSDLLKLRYVSAPPELKG